MRIVTAGALALAALALAACQGGSFGGIGSGSSVNPPVNGQPPNPYGQQAGAQNPNGVAPSPTPSTPPGQTASYAFSDAATGFKCPQSQGYSCFLRFNVPPDPSPSPTPSHSKSTKGKAKATPSPAPTPTPSATPSTSTSASPSSDSPMPTSSPLPSGAPSPSASSTPASAHVTLTLGSRPKDAPTMAGVDPKAVTTVALVSLLIRTDADEVLDGRAIADFTLPKEQLGGRSFAIQLFHHTVDRKKRGNDQFFGSYDQWKLDGDTVHFEFVVPKLEVKKDETWRLVLYASDVPSATPSPGASASPSPSPSSSASPAASAAPATSPSPR